MTLDTQLRTQLTSAVDDTTVPPGLARTALAGGRARRRRRDLGGLALGVAAVVGGVLALPHVAPGTADTQVADSGRGSQAGLEWARSLPEGQAAALPFFGRGGLWSSGEVFAVPEEVNRSMAPQEVAGGWLVFLGAGESDIAVAVLSRDGTLRRLPSETWDHGMGDARVVVSPDGHRAALGRWVVDLDTMTTTEVPHQPRADGTDGYYTNLRMAGFTDEGLIYEGAPFDRGVGTPYLLGDDGSTVEIDPPDGYRDTHVPADALLVYDDTTDPTGTCVTGYVIEDAAWSPIGHGCADSTIQRTLSVSPDGHHLLTSDLPRVWDVRDGEWDEVDVPRDLVASWGEAWMYRAAWESDDSFVLPVADPWGGDGQVRGYDQTVQVVRCTVSTGVCERAGAEQDVRVTQTWSGSTMARFAAQ
ncbi:hypothetical protein [Nocardioides hwasunensis]|uniref:WD40 repeat domain-containing protein n=1 Tax=Nocardioides hwasunensis TaxID=397258 RepID=A0ABR8MJM5_9ACTN|nr:hypothetical protein [Nocardioides hwasunensis]MBD3915775.1 hypothetical protein [Nocardioides hwasunensis]